MTWACRTAFAAALLLPLAFAADHAAAALLPGEYACIGSGGSILIGLGFRVPANDVYTDLDNKTSGRLSYGAGETTVNFIGGHLDGQVGRDIRNGRSFRINAISCGRQ
jgi:hypothetical protein